MMLADDLPIRFYPTARIVGLPDETPGIEGTPLPWRDIPINLSGDLNLIVRDKNYILHYFHAIEIFIGLFAFCREFFVDARPAQIWFGEQRWDNDAQNNVQSHLLRALWPNLLVAPVLKRGDFVELENVVHVDRSLTVSPINKFLSPLLPIAVKWGRELVRAVRPAPSRATRFRS